MSASKYFEVYYCPTCGSDKVTVYNIVATFKFTGKYLYCEKCKTSFHVEIENDDPRDTQRE